MARKKRKIILTGFRNDPEEEADRSDDDIELATRKRNHIKNFQCRDGLTKHALSQVADQENRGQSIIKKRAEATALYNCHGLTFASRRTQIDDPAAIRLILDDDNYEEVSKKDVLPGDIILYCSPNGDIEHSGIVVGAPTDRLEQPRIVSKWGIGPEFVHSATMVNGEYDLTNIRYYRMMSDEVKQ